MLTLNETMPKEERRVLYVALTRAQNELIVTRRYSNHYTADVEGQNAETAYFLNELPADLVEQAMSSSEAFPVTTVVVSAATA